MADRNAIFGAKEGRRQIGFVEGNDAFDLSGRRRATFNAKTGNLYDLDSGRVIGYISFQGKFVGVPVLADGLFAVSDDNSHEETPRKEDYDNDPEPITANATVIFEQRDADNYAVFSSAETPSPPSFVKSDTAAKLFAKSDDDGRRQTILPTENYSPGPGQVIADVGEIFERRDAEDIYARRGSVETPSPPPSIKRSETAANQQTVRTEDHSSGVGLVIADAGEIFERRNAGDVYARRSGAGTPSPPSSEQDGTAAELFSKSWTAILTKKAVRKEGYLNGPGLVVAEEVFEQDDAEAPYAVGGIDEMPSPPPSEQNKSAAGEFSKSDDNTQETVRRESHLTGSGLVVAHDAEAAYADHSIGETPSPPPSEQGEPPVEQVLKSLMAILAGKAFRKERNLNRPDLVAAGEISGQRDTEAAYAEHSVGETPSPPLSERDEPVADRFSKTDGNTEETVRRDGYLKPSPPQSERGEPAAELFSKSDDDTHQESLRRGRYSIGPGLAVAGEIFEQRDAEDVYAVRSLDEMPSPPLSEHGKPAVLTISDGEQSAPDQTKGFFDVDVEAAIAMVRNELGKEGYLNVASETPGPTKGLSGDVERAVEMIRRELARESYRSGPGVVVADETPDPTEGFFSVEMERAVGSVEKVLGKESYVRDPGRGVSGEMPDPTEALFAVDLERAIGRVQNELPNESSPSDDQGRASADDMLDQKKDLFSFEMERIVGLVRGKISK